VRETAYKHRVGESTANQISVATLILLFAGYFSVSQRRWPIDTNPKALQIGGTWVALTVVFEFALGRASGRSWEQLAQNSDVYRGSVVAGRPALDTYRPGRHPQAQPKERDSPGLSRLPRLGATGRSSRRELFAENYGC
jgi:hypothetical protein